MSNLFQLSGRATAARSPFLNILSRTRFVDAAWRALRVHPPLAEDDGRCPAQAVQRGGLFISLNNRATARAMGKNSTYTGSGSPMTSRADRPSCLHASGDIL